MADIVSGVLTYADFLVLSGKTTAEIPEAGITILAMPQTVASELACIGVTDVAMLTPEQLDLLKAWISVFIVGNITAAASSTGGILKKIDDGFVSEEYHIPKEGTVDNSGLDNELARLWNLLDLSLNPDKYANFTGCGGIGVANRDSQKLKLPIRRTQNTRPI